MKLTRLICASCGAPLLTTREVVEDGLLVRCGPCNTSSAVELERTPTYITTQNLFFAPLRQKETTEVEPPSQSIAQASSPYVSRPEERHTSFLDIVEIGIAILGLSSLFYGFYLAFVQTGIL